MKRKKSNEINFLKAVAETKSEPVDLPELRKQFARFAVQIQPHETDFFKVLNDAGKMKMYKKIFEAIYA